MIPMSDHPVTGSAGQRGAQGPGMPVDESRLAMTRRVKRLPAAERIALLDRICREQTRIAMTARRLR
jgi:hypothetical protein